MIMERRCEGGRDRGWPERVLRLQKKALHLRRGREEN